MRLIATLALFLIAAPAVASDLVRTPVTIKAAPGVTLHGELSRPTGVAQPPVIHFVQWLSCSTVFSTRDNGWTRMVNGIATQSGYAVLRVDKRGVGRSDGDCATLDFDTELADHKAVHAWLRKRPDVDQSRVVVFGASMGSRMAPLIADGQNVAGVLIWGGGTLTWFERMLGFDRHAMELSDTPRNEIQRRMAVQARLHAAYLLDGVSPPALFERDPAFRSAWVDMRGTGETDHYGRPYAFHQQAQRADWGSAWAAIDAPALAVMGEYDWFESVAGGIATEHTAPNARFVLLPKIDHHFMRYPSARAAFAGDGGVADAEAFLEVALPWLRAVAQ